jgi:hypothetical protein
VADLEERLRETVARQSLDYDPSADLPERITARVRRRHRRSQLAAAGGVAAAVIVVVAVVAIGGPDRGRVRTGDSVTTVTTAAPEESSTTSTTTPDPQAGGARGHRPDDHGQQQHDRRGADPGPGAAGDQLDDPAEPPRHRADHSRDDRQGCSGGGRDGHHSGHQLRRFAAPGRSQTSPRPLSS